VLQGVLADLELLIEESGTVVQAGRLPVIEAAPEQMRQLFQNLISNSIKYRRKDVRPFIEVYDGLTDDRVVQLFVKDNGMGLKEIDKEKIFRLFQRTQSSSKIEGNGIGLAICKKIVERHSGTIKVDSVPQVGTTFTIILPRKHGL
jgi:two-component system sensor kinase FixL